MDYLYSGEEEGTGNCGQGIRAPASPPPPQMQLLGVFWTSLKMTENLLALALNLEPPESRFSQVARQFKSDFEELFKGIAGNDTRRALFLVMSFANFLKSHPVLWENSDQWQSKLLREQLISPVNRKIHQNLIKKN